MKQHLLAIAATALLVGGCLPTEFIWWSPDGQTAAVRASDGLHLADTNGQLSAVVLPGEIQSAAWLLDNSGLVVSRSVKMKDWAAVEKLVPPEEAEAAKQMARAIPDLLKAVLTASGGSWNELSEKFIKSLGVTESLALESAWQCALSLYRKQIQDVIASFPDATGLEAEIRSSETNGISLYEISFLSMRNGRPAGEPRALLRSLHPLVDPILSPHHSILAYRTGDGALKAITLDGKDYLSVAAENVSSAVWSADGGALIHVVMGKTDKVGEIRSNIIVSDIGELLGGAGQAETLAMAAFMPNAPPRLAVLPDGRVLFASMPITLPARAASLRPVAQFFLLDPAKPGLAPAAVAVKEGSLPDDLSAFALSPDGRFVAVVESGTDVVAVLELATGKVQILSPSHPGWKSRLLPAWRNQRELSYAALPSATAARPELFLWQTNTPARLLSKAWPDDVVKPWLDGQGTGGNQRPR